MAACRGMEIKHFQPVFPSLRTMPHPLAFDISNISSRLRAFRNRILPRKKFAQTDPNTHPVASQGIELFPDLDQRAP